jgi:hypothetical protein
VLSRAFLFFSLAIAEASKARAFVLDAVIGTSAQILAEVTFQANRFEIPKVRESQIVQCGR